MLKKIVQLATLSALVMFGLCVGHVVSADVLLENLVARSFYVYDVHTETVLLERSGEAQLPIASITKLVTAMAALELMGENTQIEVTPEALEEEGDSGLIVGEKWRLGDLVSFMLVSSSNDAAKVLEIAAGPDSQLLKSMNESAKRMGLSQSFFLNTTGLDISNNLAGAYSSARDVEVIISKFNNIYPNILYNTTKTEIKFSSDIAVHTVRNTNQFTKSMPSLLGSKTGSTDLAGANLTVIFDSEIGRPVVATVLGSTQDDRFDDALKLIEKTLNNLVNQNAQ